MTMMTITLCAGRMHPRISLLGLLTRRRCVLQVCESDNKAESELSLNIKKATSPEETAPSESCGCFSY